MSRELSSARSFWKRKEARAGRWSRYVEVEEVSLESVEADAIENGLVDQIVGILGTGKEANVYLGLWKDAPIALKVYRLHRTPYKKKAMIGYAVDKMGAIAAREFTLLLKAYRAGVPVPTPARRVDNMFTMRYLGDNGRAPLLKETLLEEPASIAEEAFKLVENLLGASIAHGDLSEYNLVFHDGHLFVIDFPQAVDFSSRVDRHLRIEEAKTLLVRDLQNLARYFARYDIFVDATAEYRRLIEKMDIQANGSLVT